jgi:hypothetical protein
VSSEVVKLANGRWANPPAEAADLVAQILVDVRDGDDTQGHFHAFAAARGLTIVNVVDNM